MRRAAPPPLSLTLSGSTGPAAVVVVVLVVVEVAGAGEVAALEVVAWTSRRLSLLVEGAVGSGGVAGLVFVSARGAFWTVSTGLELGAADGALVCAFTTVRAVKSAAPAQR